MSSPVSHNQVFLSKNYIVENKKNLHSLLSNRVKICKHRDVTYVIFYLVSSKKK